MSDTLPSNSVLFAGEPPQTLTTCASRNLMLSGERLVTSSRCRYVGGTIARFTAAAMRPHGGLLPCRNRFATGATVRDVLLGKMIPDTFPLRIAKSNHHAFIADRLPSAILETGSRSYLKIAGCRARAESGSEP
jgi:hypothetical protein